MDPNVLNLVLILGAAAIGGALAVRLKQPIIVGYLVGGVIVGPFTPGPQADFDQFRVLTEVGLALLLFVLGAGMPVSHFRGLGSVIIVGGLVQIVLTIAMGFLFVVWMGLSIPQGLLLGIILAQTSSAVIAKVLDDRQEADSVHGRIAAGISAVQDLSSLPLLLLLLVFLGDRDTTYLSILTALGQVAALAIATYVVGRLLWPRLLQGFGRMASDEVTLLVALGLALGGGLIMQAIGLSFAIGAFLAGLVIAESPQRPAAISRVLPLRDVFAAMFFVSIGALFDPAVLWRSPLHLLAVLAVGVIGKAAVSAFAIRRLGHSGSTAVLTGLLLAQLGEFAFIVANIGLERGAISAEMFSIVIAAVVISIFTNSLVLDSAPPVLAVLARMARFNALLKQPPKRVRTVFRKRNSPTN